MTKEIKLYVTTDSYFPRALVSLCSKVFKSGYKVAILCPSDLVSEVDRLLWQTEQLSFIPHDTADSDTSSEQPILITDDIERVNNDATVLFSLFTGNEVIEKSSAFDKVCFFVKMRKEAEELERKMVAEKIKYSIIERMQNKWMVKDVA